MKKNVIFGIAGVALGVGIDRVIQWATKKFKKGTRKEEVVYHISDDTPPKPKEEVKAEEPKKEKKDDSDSDEHHGRRSLVEGHEPIVVSEDDYQFRYGGYNEKKIVYYTDSGIFVNAENDIPLERPQLVLGEDAVWAMEQQEAKVLYVHDESMMMNYIIEATDEVYADLDDLAPDDDEEDEEE